MSVSSLINIIRVFHMQCVVYRTIQPLWAQNELKLKASQFQWCKSLFFSNFLSHSFLKFLHLFCLRWWDEYCADIGHSPVRNIEINFPKLFLKILAFIVGSVVNGNTKHFELLSWKTSIWNCSAPSLTVQLQKSREVPNGKPMLSRKCVTIASFYVRFQAIWGFVCHTIVCEVTTKHDTWLVSLAEIQILITIILSTSYNVWVNEHTTL